MAQGVYGKMRVMMELFTELTKVVSEKSFAEQSAGHGIRGDYSQWHLQRVEPTPIRTAKRVKLNDRGNVDHVHFSQLSSNFEQADAQYQLAKVNYALFIVQPEVRERIDLLEAWRELKTAESLFLEASYIAIEPDMQSSWWQMLCCLQRSNIVVPRDIRKMLYSEYDIIRRPEGVHLRYGRCISETCRVDDDFSKWSLVPHCITAHMKWMEKHCERFHLVSYNHLVKHWNDCANHKKTTHFHRSRKGYVGTYTEYCSSCGRAVSTGAEKIRLGE